MQLSSFYFLLNLKYFNSPSQQVFVPKPTTLSHTAESMVRIHNSGFYYTMKLTDFNGKN